MKFKFYLIKGITLFNYTSLYIIKKLFKNAHSSIQYRLSFAVILCSLFGYDTYLKLQFQHVLLIGLIFLLIQVSFESYIEESLKYAKFSASIAFAFIFILIGVILFFGNWFSLTGPN